MSSDGAVEEGERDDSSNDRCLVIHSWRSRTLMSWTQWKGLCQTPELTPDIRISQVTTALHEWHLAGIPNVTIRCDRSGTPRANRNRPLWLSCRVPRLWFFRLRKRLPVSHTTALKPSKECKLRRTNGFPYQCMWTMTLLCVMLDQASPCIDGRQLAFLTLECSTAKT